jgi:hypothetical protein
MKYHARYRPLNGELTRPSLLWTQVALWWAATAIAVGLIHQSIVIARWNRVQPPFDRQLRFAAQFEVLWRAAVAVLFAAIIVTRILVGLHYVELPEDQAILGTDVVTDYLLWLLLLLVLRACVYQARPVKAPVSGGFFIAAPIWIGLVLFAAYALIHTSLIMYLVHLACRGIDATLEFTGNRYPLWNERQEAIFALRAAVAVLAWLIGTILATQSLANRRARTNFWRIASAIVGVSLIAAAGGFVWWFGAYAYSQVSPDLAGTGVASNWYQRLGAGVILAVLAGVGAARVAQIKQKHQPGVPARAIALPLAAESWLVVVLLLAEFGYLMIQAVASFIGPNSMLGWDDLPYLLTNPDLILMTALLIASWRLAALRRKRMLPQPLALRPMSGPRFFTAFVMLLMSLAVGIPTLAIFSFSFWLGPWYRW